MWHFLLVCLGFFLNIHSSFCEMYYFSWKRNKGSPGAWSSDRWSWMYRYFFVNLSPLFIKCYWILARWVSFWNLWNSLTSLYKPLRSSTLEAFNGKQRSSWGGRVWAPFKCPGCGGVTGQWHRAALSREGWPQRRCSTAASPKSKPRDGAELTCNCREYKYGSTDSVLN